MSQLTKFETDHRSANLIMGSSSSVLQLLFFESPLAQGKAKGLGQWEYVNGKIFFAICFLLPNGTPTPSFIG
jgi:hypothetical protein